MPSYIQVIGGKVVSYGSAKDISGIPGAIEATPEMLSDLRLAEDERAARGQTPASVDIVLDAEGIKLQPDTRIGYDVTASSTLVAVGERVTINADRLLPDGQPDTKFSGMVIFPLSDGTFWRFDFVNGAASKSWVPTRSVNLVLFPSDDYRLVAPLSMVVYE